MSTDSSTRIPPTRLPSLHLERWRDVPRWCGSTHPGVGSDNPRVMDFSKRESTPDQQRIEDELERRISPQDRILHVGVGNSSLARRFAHHVKQIVGLTLSGDERRHGLGLGIPDYEVLLINKYSHEVATLPGPFDFIIDNNPASFGCCVGHFQIMLENYARLLLPGALMVTEQTGLEWCYGNGAMKLDFDDLKTLCNVYPFEARRLGEQVFALQRLTVDADT